MHAFSMHLWKEWRDHRATFFGFWLLLALAAPALTLLLPREQVIDGQLVNAFALVALIVAACVIGCEVIPGEANRNTLPFLARLPHGLHFAFWSKALFIALAVLVFALSGMLAAFAARAVLLGHVWLNPWSRPVWDLTAYWLVLSGSLWIFALSSWLPRGILAVPFAGVLLVPYGLAAWFCSSQLGTSPRLRDPILTTMQDHLLVQPILALAVAWVSFVLGRRFGGGPSSSLKKGLAATALVFLPLWSWLGWHVNDWFTARPGPQTTITSGMLGSDGKHAFLNTRRGDRWPLLGLVVDLESGAWRRSGELNHGFCSPMCVGNFNLFEYGNHSLVLQTVDGQTYRCLDGATANEIGTTHAGAMFAEQRELARASLRANAPMRLRDGRRAWFIDRHLEVESADGSIAEWEWDRGDVPHLVAGFGVRTFDHESRAMVVCDFERKRLFRAPTHRFSQCFVLGRYWLVGDMDKKTHETVNCRLFDPDTCETRAVPALMQQGRVVTVLDDGRVVVCTGSAYDPKRVHLFALTLPEGTCQELELPYPMRPDPRAFSVQSLDYQAPARGPDGRRFFRLSGDHRASLTSLPLGSNRLTPAIPFRDLLGCLDARHAIVIAYHGHALERVDLETGARVQVFPRPAPHPDFVQGTSTR